MAVVARDVRVWLSDFGLAKDTATGSRYTRTGSTLGTPNYMSPEQARGELTTLTPASDVWALGCVLHECCTGRRAFEGDSPAAILGAVLTGAATPGAHVPPPVRALIEGCLQRSAAGRHRTASGVRDDCARVLAARSPAHRPRRAIRRRRLAGAALALLATGAAGWAIATGHDAARRRDATSDAGTALAAEAARLQRVDPARAHGLLAEAVARAPHRDDWRIDLGLLRWAAGQPPEAIVAAWDGIDRASPRYVHGRWLAGLVWLGVHIERQDVPIRAKTEAAWAAAAAGTGPEAGWARAGLALIEGRVDVARAAVAGSDAWSVGLLRGLIELQVSNTQDAAWDLEAGIAALTRAVGSEIPIPSAYLNRGVLLARRGDHAAAERDYGEALRCWPDYTLAYVNRAAARIVLRDLAGAHADLERALALTPGSVIASAHLARLLDERGEAERARALYDRVLAETPGLLDARNGRGFVRLKLGDHAGALADFLEAVRLDPACAAAHAGRAQARRGVGDAPGALQDLDAALRLDPDNPQYLVSRGRLRAALGDGSGARADLDAAHRLRPDDAEPLYERACLRGAQGDAAGARADYDTVLAIRPTFAQARVNRGILRERAGDQDGALADYEAALAAEPTLAPALHQRGKIRARRGDLAGALADYDAALQASPDLAEAHGSRAEVRAALRDLPGALADYEALVAARPTLPEAQGGLGRLHMRMSHWAAAADRFRWFLAHAPDHPVAGQIQRGLSECERQLAGPNPR
jgi:tetratricopeptide (TPR) repeat protein